MIGLQVEEMVEEYHRIPLNIFREMALITPLRRLKHERPDERLVLWVDALDEDPAGEQTIATILPNADELQSLGNLWVVVASRPGQHLERFLHAGAELIDISDECFAEDNHAFMQAYICRALADSQVQAAITAVGKDDLNLPELVFAQAGDNPLYLNQFFQTVRSGGLSALLQGGLPSGLEAIQARLLAAVAASAGTSFGSEFLPVLQVFAVACRPLSRAQLIRFSGLVEDQVGNILRVLQPYLEVLGKEPDATYALYHRSFQETLIAAKHQDQPWYVSSTAAHDRMSEVYRKGSFVNLEALDEYGLNFLSAHLASGGEQACKCLMKLPSREWRRVRRRAAFSNWPFKEDLRLVLQKAKSLPLEEAIPISARIALVAGITQDAERELPAGLLKAMVRLGWLQRSLDAVSPEMENGQQVERLAEIASALGALSTSLAVGAEPAKIPEIYYQVLHQALQLLLHEPSGVTLANLLEVCPVDASATMRDILAQAAEIARNLQPDWQRPPALIEVARLYTAVDSETAKSWFHTALDDCQVLLRSSLTFEQERLVRYWAAFDPQALAELLPRLRFSPDIYSVRTVLNLGRGLNASGTNGALADLTAQVEGTWFAGFQCPYQRALCEVEIALAHHELSELEPAQAALGRARLFATQIGGELDPDSAQQQRPRQRVDALISIAGLAVKLAHPEAQDLLEEAWNAYAKCGSFNISPAELVKPQVHIESGLLEIYLNQIADPKRQATARLAAVDTLLDSSISAHKELARGWFDLALESAEYSVQSAWDGPFVYAAVLAAPPEKREATLQWVRSKLQPEEEISFRLNVLNRMPMGDPQRPDWLAETLQVWMDSSSNENYYDQLPTALLCLPGELTGPLLVNPPQIADSLKRCYLTLVLSALAEHRAPNSGRALFEQALELIPEAATQRTPAAMLQAYAAGMWWTLDPRRTSDLWTQALAWLNSDAFERDLNNRHYWLMLLTRILEAGAPQAALQMYLSSPEPSRPPDSFFIVVPGALVDPIIQAGLSEHDYYLGLAVGRSLASESLSPLSGFIANLVPPATRALALIGAAATGSMANRLRMAKSAIEAAQQVEPPHLRWLLYARGVSALSRMGAHQLALERLRPAVHAILQALPVFGTLPMSAYGHALGLLTASLLTAGEIDEALALLFSASALGAEGVYRTLSEICRPLVTQVKPDVLDNLMAQIEEAKMVMTP